jgi:predicted Zn-dependent peptidase
MFAEVLGLSPINRLFMNIREDLGICYYCDLTTFRSKNSAFISAGIKLKRKNEVFDAILCEIEDIAKGNLTDEEINTAKTSVINAYVSLFDSPKDHESIVINSVLGSQYLSFEEYEEKINNVTAQNIVDIAKKMKLRTVFTLLGI